MNRSVSWAQWDEKLLALELREIRDVNFDLNLTGFEIPEIEGILAPSRSDPEDLAPPPPEVATTQLGDL